MHERIRRLLEYLPNHPVIRRSLKGWRNPGVPQPGRGSICKYIIIRAYTMTPKRPKEPDFHFDEMVWRSDSAMIDQAMMELSSIRDDIEFERKLFLIRLARVTGGLENERLLHRQTGHVGLSLQKVIAILFGVFLSLLDKLFSLREGSLILWNLLFRNRRPSNDES